MDRARPVNAQSDVTDGAGYIAPYCDNTTQYSISLTCGAPHHSKTKKRRKGRKRKNMPIISLLLRSWHYLPSL